MPFYASIGQSIELSLKAYLLANGMNLEKIRKKYGHNLNKLIDSAIDKNINNVSKISNVDYGVIQLMSEEYLNKRYHYIKTGKILLPEPDLVLDAANSLTINLEKYCHKTLNGKMPNK